MLDILSHEGICLQPYLDSVGVWTIGAGQTAHDGFNPRTAGPLTLRQVFDLFKVKIKSYTDAVDALQLDLTQYQYDALTSLCYNFGPGNLRKLCRGRTIPQIGEAIMLYTIPKEITARRYKEQTLFKVGRYSNADGHVLVFPVSGGRPQYGKGYRIDARPYLSGELGKPELPKVPPTAPTAPSKPAGAPVAPPVKPSFLSYIFSAIKAAFTRKE